MIDLLHRFIIPAAYSVLPSAMASDRATAMLLAIGLQESKLQHRKQTGGPARSFFQFERIGVAGVLGHKASRDPIKAACEALCERADIETCYGAITHNDVLASAFARCLLWTLPDSLPGPTEHERGWTQYLSAWRPGKPKPLTWRAHYAQAWGVVGTARVTERLAMSSVPNRLAVVERMAELYAPLLKTNTYASCAEFTQRVLNELARVHPDDQFGATLKNAGENGYMFSDGIRRSHDVITHKATGTQVDILTAGGGREEPGPEGPRDAGIKWAEIERPYRPHNVWVKPFDFEDSTPPPPSNGRVPYPGDAFWDSVTAFLEEDMRSVGQTLNFQSGRWIARTIWDAVVGDEQGNVLTLEESLKKHRNEWRAVLRLPPL